MTELTGAQQARLSLLADVIENAKPVEDPATVDGFYDGRSPELPERFNMQVVNGKAACGTVGCIQGYMEAISWKELEAMGDSTLESLEALYGLSYYNYDNLCMPQGYSHDFNPTPKHAAAVIRHFRDTGEVDWDVGKDL